MNTDSESSIMALRCNRVDFLPSLWLLHLVLTVTGSIAPTESTAKRVFKGEVGGNVTIDCPITHGAIDFFYFQKGVTYVNGYHAFKNISVVKPWVNTSVEHGKTTVHMYNLKLSQSGEYECIIHYSKSENPSKTLVHLNITATYRKPKVTMECRDASCNVTCESHGYPFTRMNWSVPGGHLWEVVNESPSSSNQETKLFNSFSKASFNCSNGEMLVRCFVGSVTSDLFSVCTPENQPNTAVIPAAITAVVIFCVITGILWWWKCKKSTTGAAALDVRQWGGNGSEEERVELK